MRKSHAFAGFSVLAVFLACGGDDGASTGSASLTVTCERICVRLNAAACTGDSPNACMSTCVTTASGFPSACSVQGSTFETCAAKATYTCDADKQAQPVGCEAEQAALVSCIAANQVVVDSGAVNHFGTDAGTTPVSDASTGPAIPDAGVGIIVHDGGDSFSHDGGGVVAIADAGIEQCTPVSGATACQTCGAEYCCAEISACDDDCESVIECTGACDNGPEADSDACYAACNTSNTKPAIAAYNAIGACLQDNCDVECF